MNLIVDGSSPLNGERLLAPENKNGTDLYLFMHVCQGMVAITESAFFDKFMPIFELHDIECFLPAEFSTRGA